MTPELKKIIDGLYLDHCKVDLESASNSEDEYTQGFALGFKKAATAMYEKMQEWVSVENAPPPGSYLCSDCDPGYVYVAKYIIPEDKRRSPLWEDWDGEPVYPWYYKPLPSPPKTDSNE